MANPGQDADMANYPTQNPEHVLRRRQQQRWAADKVLGGLRYEYVGWQDPVGRVSVDYDYGYNGRGSRSASAERRYWQGRREREWV